MIVKKLICAAAFGLSMLSGAAFAADPQGTWLSGDGGTKVHISNCGGKLCGKVVWLQEPTDPKTGKPKTDALNPDPAKQARPMIGLQVVNGLTPSGADRWSGSIYNADDGKTYSANMQLTGDSTAKVEGCVLGILCKGQTWKRASN
jgi:uncharacterized protein (DUF2147 family)